MLLAMWLRSLSTSFPIFEVIFSRPFPYFEWPVSCHNFVSFPLGFIKRLGQVTVRATLQLAIYDHRFFLIWTLAILSRWSSLYNQGEDLTENTASKNSYTVVLPSNVCLFTCYIAADNFFRLHYSSFQPLLQQESKRNSHWKLSW
jgi:hypothetical protein